MIEVDTSE